MNYKLKSGFTLIEILVVIGIIGMIAVIGSNIFFTILRGSTKTRLLAEVKQNGNYALGVMERMVRNAKQITSSCELGMTTIKIEDLNKEETEFTCLDVGTPNGRVSLRLGTSVEEKRLTSRKVKVDTCSFDCQPGQKGVSPDRVTIRFGLSQAEVTTRPEEQAQADFKTTVALRNY